MTQYREADVPTQHGKTALVTGANTGIGYDTARVLALRGARVLLACRSEEKAAAAIDKIRAIKSDVDISFEPLDLASLASVEACAERVRKEDRLDLLINNAGVMMPPKLSTDEGFELQFGVNHLGHFALTGRLLPMLNERDDARVVNVSSLAHRNGRIDYQDVHAERTYNRMARYSMSKFANLLFTFELQRKLVDVQASTLSVACHPGGSATELGRHFSPLVTLMLTPMQFFMNSSAEGALPTLMAATHHDVQGSDYFGPTQMGEMRSSARKVRTVAAARDEADAAKLWEISTELTGVNYTF